MMLTLVMLVFTGVAVGQAKLKEAADLYRAGKFQDAITGLELLNSTKGSTNLSSLFLGAAYVQMGKEAEARAAFQQAHHINEPKDIDGETPIKIAKKPSPNFHGNNIGEKHSALFAVEFKADKTIGFIFVVDFTNEKFKKMAAAAAKKLVFVPATSEGKPVTVIKLVQYDYELY